MKRLDELDWLRGCMALAILIYHSALFGNLGMATGADSVVGRMGIYGVSIFFVLSGLSMAHVYHAFFRSWGDGGRFFLRRLFRILPLLWLVVGLKVITTLAAGGELSAKVIALNLTALFGFVRPTAYMNVGAWSIGSEMVFYALTPAILWLFSRSRAAGVGVLAISLAIGAYYAFVALSPEVPLAQQWAVYIQPFNNLFLYLAGIALFYLPWPARIPPLWAAVGFWAPMVAIAAYPVVSAPAVPGDQIALVTGWNRVAFSAFSIALVAAFYRLAPRLPPSLSRLLVALGTVTYGVYLLHPFAIDAMLAGPAALARLPAPLFIAGVTLITAAVAALVYVVLERPMIAVGKRLTQRRPV